jgi:uncharacterized protein
MNASQQQDFEQTVIQDTRHWLERAVIGLNLCPFAKAVHVKGQIHYVVSQATKSQALLEVLVSELQALQACDPMVRDTTLLMSPNCLQNFHAFNDFLAEADEALVELGMDGFLQIASFHPRFQFAGTRIDVMGNFTNRAPYPTLHLLREDSIERAVDAFPDAESIFGKNIETLEQLGKSGWTALGLKARVGLTETQTPAQNKAAKPRGKIKP